ncbi:MAG: hypothetical protein HY543_08470, partial [Deltaproteobacteria bacterium]|nr:hypothetical protein [Deltaproteobacteria bacterium]
MRRPSAITKASARTGLLVIFAGMLALIAALAISNTTPARAQNSLFSATPSTGFITPGQGTRGDVFGPGAALAPAQQAPLNAPNSVAPNSVAPMPMPMVPAGQVALALSARFGKQAPVIAGGLTWRVYAAKADPGGAFRLVKEDRSPAPTLVLPPGGYIVHVGFGLATAVKPVTLRGQTVREEFDLPAGGLRMEGRVGDVRVPAGQISFDVYRGSQFEAGDRRPIAERVMTG